MSAFQKVLPFVMIMFATLLSGCGGGSGGDTTAGIGGTGQIASGTITGFGSIFVNGIEFFDIDSATCVIDDNDSTGNCQANLQLGMVVKVTGTNDGATGNATEVIYNDDVDGPVSTITPYVAGEVTRTLSVLGTTILIDSASTAFTGAKGFNDLAVNDLIEVSGYFDNNGTLNATFVRYKGTLQLGSTATELKGTVTATVPVSGAASPGDTFTVNGITISVVNGTDLGDMGGQVTTGDGVEVRGTLIDPTTIDADRVKPEDDVIGNEGDEVSIEGLITNFVSATSFLVNGQQVNAGSASLDPATLLLENGIKVEVEGNIVNGVLVADTVESRNNDIKINATVDSTDAGTNTITMRFGNGGTLDVQLNNQTQMEDKTGAATGFFDLTDIQTGDYLEIRGFSAPSGMTQIIMASELRRDELDNDLLQGPVDTNGIVADTSITLFGLTFTTDGNTGFENDNGSTNSSTFYAEIQEGCTVKIQDGDLPSTPPDGIADEIELTGSCP